MKFVAEITLRTVPFEAEDADDARRKMGAFDRGLAVEVLPPCHVIEVALFEVEDVDG